MINCYKSILMLTLHILLPNRTNLKKRVQFENMVFVIVSTRENTRLTARASLLRFASRNASSLNRNVSYIYLKAKETHILITVYFVQIGC